MPLAWAEAEQLVGARSRQRDPFIRERLGADVSDRALYDAVFSNERHSMEAVAAAITAYVTRARG